MTMSTKLQPRYCSIHSGQLLTIACSKCFSVNCLRCMIPTQKCSIGGEVYFEAGRKYLSFWDVIKTWPVCIKSPFLGLSHSQDYTLQIFVRSVLCPVCAQVGKDKRWASHSFLNYHLQMLFS